MQIMRHKSHFYLYCDSMKLELFLVNIEKKGRLFALSYGENHYTMPNLSVTCPTTSLIFFSLNLWHRDPQDCVEFNFVKNLVQWKCICDY